METRITNLTPVDTAETARKAAYQVGPRVYRLTGINTDPVRFFVIGCHGNGGASQHKTAALMNKMAEELQKSDEQTPAFILFLGDNIYDYGVGSPHDPGFNSCFHNVYYDASLTATNKLPCWMILGNHDVNMHAKAFLGRHGQGEATGMHQVAHTYIANTPDNIGKKAAIFKQTELPSEKLAHWNMPYLFYSIIAGNTQIFCLNSNSYLKDYLNLVSGKTQDGMDVETGHANQAAWFQTEYEAAKKAGRQVFVAQHHPLFLAGKRSFPNKYDSTHYLTQQQIEELNGALKAQNPDFIETESYNELLASTYMQQGIEPDLVFAAHEHFISYYNDLEMPANKQVLRQFTSGGGGGELHERASYRGHPYVSLHQQHNGFGMMTCDPADTKKFTLDVFTLEGLRLRFNESSHHAIAEENNDLKVERLKQCVMQACERYFSILKEEELASTEPVRNLQEKPPENAGMFSSFYKKVTDISTFVYYATSNTLGHFLHDREAEKENRIVQDIQAYFSQIRLTDMQKILEHLYQLTQQLPYKDVESNTAFYTVLQETVTRQFGFDLHVLFNAAGLWQNPLMDGMSEHTVKM